MKEKNQPRRKRQKFTFTEEENQWSVNTLKGA